MANAWALNVAYRGDVIIWTLVDAISPIISLAVWYTVSLQGNTSLNPRDTITYYILTILALTATNSWLGYFLTQEILDGRLVRSLVRPLSTFWEHAADNIVTKLIRMPIPVLTIIVIAHVFPNFFSPSLYEGPRIVLGIVSIILGATIAFLADAILASLSFWIEDVHQIIGYHHLLYSFASGIIIPFALMPALAQKLFSVLPYRYIVSAPVEILVSSAQSSNTFTLLATQVAWTVVLAVALRLIWKSGLKVYAIPGQ